MGAVELCLVGCGRAGPPHGTKAMRDWQLLLCVMGTSGLGCTCVGFEKLKVKDCYDHSFLSCDMNGVCLH